MLYVLSTVSIDYNKEIIVLTESAFKEDTRGSTIYMHTTGIYAVVSNTFFFNQIQIYM